MPSGYIEPPSVAPLATLVGSAGPISVLSSALEQSRYEAWLKAVTGERLF